LPTDNAIVLTKPKHGMLPILTVLFVISYGLMAMLVVEQARTIDAQRYLIRSLFSDSTELTSLKGKLFQKQRAEAQANAQAQTPSSQASPQDRKGKSANKLHKQAPQKPPRPASDLEDVRRALISI
jgi:hypothetical protein